MRVVPTPLGIGTDHYEPVVRRINVTQFVEEGRPQLRTSSARGRNSCHTPMLPKSAIAG
jgi:hypothetical protein